MTPDNIREEGDRLIKIFKPLCSGNSQTDINDKLAAKASIKAVEEIIKLVDGDSFYAVHTLEGEKFVDQVEYWNEVLNYLKSKL